MAAKTTPKQPGPTANDVRILFGPGGYVRMVDYGRGEPAEEPVDLTGYAEALAAIGMTVPRTIAPPCEVTGSVVVDLGDGGRALWVDGGGDISAVEVAWAVVAALEERIADALAAMDEINRQRDAAWRSQTEKVFRDALAAAGYTPRRVTGFLRRRRTDLGNRSVLDVLDDEHRTREDVLSAVLEVALALSEHPGILDRFMSDLGADRSSKRNTDAAAE